MTCQKREPLTLRLDRVLPGVRDSVFRACTEPDELAQWWGPHGSHRNVYSRSKGALRDLDESIEFVLVQSGFATEERLALHDDGWTQSLDRLQLFLATPRERRA